MLAACAASVLAVGLAGSGVFTSVTENLLYQDDIVLVRQTRYQRIVVTKWHNDVRLYLDGGLQFSSVDECRYHEALVHPAMAAAAGARRILIVGGGDGMAARELLKYSRIDRIDLVDLDAEMIHLFRDRPLLAELSQHALANPKVHLHIQDAGRFLEESSDSWDLIVLDLPDPSHLSLARLYATSFYKLLSQHLNEGGIAVTQASSPFYSPEAFWCIVKTWKQTSIGPERKGRFAVYPYHNYVPSFGDWGFVMASRRNLDTKNLTLDPQVKLRFLTQDLLPTLFVFGGDSLQQQDVQPNRLDDQVLTKYYRRGWKRFGP